MTEFSFNRRFILKTAAALLATSKVSLAVGEAVPVPVAGEKINWDAVLNQVLADHNRRAAAVFPLSEGYEPGTPEWCLARVLRQVAYAKDHDTHLPGINDFDLDWRPKGYDGLADLDGYLDGGLKPEAAQRRREIVQKTLTENPRLAMKSANEDDTTGREGLHQRLTTGDTLPLFEDGEVELARIAMPGSIHSDAISVRARMENGRYHYRVLDEYDGMFVNDEGIPAPTNAPLTLGELIALIDECELVTATRDMINEGEGPEVAHDWLEVHSAVYPALSLWYRAEGKRWLAENTWDEEDEFDEEEA